MKSEKSKFILIALICCALYGCDDFVYVDPPRTDLVRSSVFSDESTAQAAVLGIYQFMSNAGFASGDFLSITLYASLSSDDLTNYAGDNSPENLEFSGNSLQSSNTIILSLWQDMYGCIYKCNAVLESLDKSKIANIKKEQLIGEVSFLRAFCYFYLVNLFGDVPIVTTTDFRQNFNISRSPTSNVYDLIIKDLINAKTKLPELYTESNGRRVRVNKFAATALLSRSYLYLEDWENADLYASEVIESSLYSLEKTLSNVFLITSTESIWQLATPANAWETGVFFFSGTPMNVALSDSIVNSFEPNDKRKNEWIGSTTDDIGTYYYPYKYKAFDYDPQSEYSMVIRLSEMYLIRSEAKAMRGQISKAISDLDSVRSRAGISLIGDSNLPINDATLLNLIEHERQVELFTEWGHRWLDLKRTGRLNIIMSRLRPEWQETDSLYPIPDLQIQNDPAMKNQQNPGY